MELAEDTQGEDNAQGGVGEPSTSSDRFLARLLNGEAPRVQLTGQYTDWFLDYASYVILERAVPHLDDGLKPVQRRILHSMKLLDDGWYNKVANIIGHTMQFHPHGDASIGDALVQMGQKDLLIDTQGNWGNILTGDTAAAPRYIEARLSPFALEVVYNPKTTEWMKSYDGRNQEPVTLPVKFPLLLAQGAEGIAVGLSSKILPHNTREIIDAAIAYLKGEPFTLYPDFTTGGLIDCERYNDGQRGGMVKVRARIERTDRKTLTIREIPFSKDTSRIIESIRKANDSGKIRVRKVEDNTASEVEIVVHLGSDISPDKTIDALYAFTECEISIWPNACVIKDGKPLFLGVSDILRHSVDRTKDLLAQELNIRLNELAEIWHFASLERIFIENRIYLSIEQCTTWEAVISTIAHELEPYAPMLRRPITEEDIVRLTEIKIKRISKFDAKKNDELIKSTEREMEEVEDNLNHLVRYAIQYFERIAAKYAKDVKRRTEISSFDTIEATRVVVANRKLYVDREGGFIGTDLKGAEFVGDCSDIDDAIVIMRSGKYVVTPVEDKKFVDKDIIYAGVYMRNASRTIYNIVHRDGRSGQCFVKRCAITNLIRDREYYLTTGTPGSKILYLSVNPNGEAETVQVTLSTSLRIKASSFEFDFGTLAIKGRGARGNQLTRHPVREVRLVEKGESTLGGLKVWIDRDVNRLNVEERGQYLGEFSGSDRVLAIYANGTYQTLDYDPSTRFQEELIHVDKFDADRVYAAVFFDSDQGYTYLKRFTLEESEALTSFIGNSAGAKLLSFIIQPESAVEIHLAGTPKGMPGEMVDVDSFIGVKSHRARGKRLSNRPIARVTLHEPEEKARQQEQPSEDE